MTPEQKIKFLILKKNAEWKKEPAPDATDENIDSMFDGEENVWDAKDEVRGGEVETNITPPYSRHYEARSVAAQMPDKSWVGWTYWYGGGKHGEPEEVDWMNEAYDLECSEEEKMVTVRAFSRPIQTPST